MQCRELQRQKDEAEAALEGESRKRRDLEGEVAALQRRAEQAEVDLRQARGASNSEEVVRSLRSELRSQESAIKEARRMQDRIKCTQPLPLAPKLFLPTTMDISVIR